MKKIMFLLAAVIFSTVMFAQDRKMSELKTNQLPKGVTDFLSQNLPGAKITRAGKIEEKSELTYVAVVEIKGTKHAYLFDKNGKFKGKGDHLFNNQNQNGSVKPASSGSATPAREATHVALPPVKTEPAKQAPKAPASETAAPKK